MYQYFAVHGKIFRSTCWMLKTEREEKKNLPKDTSKWNRIVVKIIIVFHRTNFSFTYYIGFITANYFLFTQYVGHCLN